MGQGERSDQANSDFLPGAHYHWLTPLYELGSRPMLGTVWRQVADDVVQAAAVGASVLDLGCGPGTVLRALAERRPDLMLSGIDIDEQMLALASRRLGGYKLLHGPIDAVPMVDHSIDVVFSSMVFHHLSRDVKQRAMDEALRLLQPGGVFLLCDFSVPQGRFGRGFVWLFGKFETGVATQARGELLEIASSKPVSIHPCWTRWGCITQYEFQPMRAAETSSSGK